ncbi:VirD4-like conjugal transfer protein, CD1115 family [Clostridium cellulovorans]|uniref:TRAG family protein n=1 Tax=Clostridium cellulovorans (strain ATCC 35296 / DSM 3052 / OCM 3 / 743B) TaxID=573061 RepID=D9SPS4_CLOC7|nr:type IV secretory system conjugative DNA transfer family protein [Clostridium cellulovorans]ADL52060.1 TRAG family protein [Clostridium cellulovorans 743B]
MKKLKQKLLLVLFLIIVGSIFNIYFSTNLHLLLSRQSTRLSIPETKYCIESMVSSKQHLMLFLCLNSLIVILVVLLMMTNNKPYESRLISITPDISTPVAVGQKQFGSARWLTEKEKEEAFESFILDEEDPLIKYLIEHGQDDLKEDIEKEGEENEEKEQAQQCISNTEQEICIENSEDKFENVSSDPKKYISKGGIVLGLNKEKGKEKIYFIGEDVHSLCIGATRCGKTRTEVLQSVGVMALAGESMIFSDPKAELYQYTHIFLERLGYEVIAIDFKNPLKSNRYNFLQPIIEAVDRDDIAAAVDATWDLTSQLVGEPKGERIWTDGNASIIASSIMSVVYDNRHGANKKYQNMTNVYFFISEMCKTIGKTMPIIEYNKRLSPTHPAKGLLAISEVAPSKTRGSFYTAALTTLRLFTNPLINSMTNASDYDPKETGSKKRALFIILPDENTTYYPLASLLVAQHYSELVKSADARGGRLKNRVNFLLEEFGNFTQIPDFSSKLTVGGGRGIRFNLILQGFSQLDEKYGKDVAKTIKGNCENWVYLQSDDSETLEELSKKLGNYTVSTYSLSASHGKFTNPSSSHSINLTGRALLTTDEIRLIKRPYSLITSRNNPGMMHCPDLSQWNFNKMYGLGDMEHNRKVRELRENRRPARTARMEDMQLWGIWHYYTAKSAGGMVEAFKDSIISNYNPTDTEYEENRKEDFYGEE